MWYLQLIAEYVALGLANEALLNATFAALVLWAGFGKTPKVCAVVTAVLHIALVVM
jgi:hypothetical protein